MPSPESIDRVVRFGVFELDLSARELRKRGRRVHLQDQPFEALILLLNRRGAIVTRDELRQHLWPSDTFVVFDDSLNTVIRKLRDALGDSAESPRFIETVPRHGYRFIGSSELESSVVDSPLTGTEVHPTGRRWWSPIWPALVPVALLAGLVVWRTEGVPVRDEPLQAIALTTLPGVELYPSISPDGEQVAFTWQKPEEDNPDVYVQMIESSSPLRLTTDPRAEFDPVWSPDGRWIAFLRADRPPTSSAMIGNAELQVIPPLGGPERQIAKLRLRTMVGTPAFLAWCPDSTCLIVTDSPGEDTPDALFVVSLETGEKRPLTHPRHPLLGDCNPALAPDGRSLVFRRVPGAAAGELYWLHLGKDLSANGEPRRLTGGQLNGAFPSWMPDGNAIVFSAKGRLWTQSLTGDDKPAQLPFVGEEGLMPVVSRPRPGEPARLIYVRSLDDMNIWRLDTPGPGTPALSPPVVAIASTKQDITPDLSADSRRVAFASNRSGALDVWLAAPDGSDAIKLTSMNAETVAAPRWSPDGQLIAYQSNREGQFEVYVVPAAGGKPRNLTSHPANDHVPSFSRDGRWIYFGSTRTGEFHIWKAPVSGGDAVQVSSHVGFRAVEGTDGRELYFSDNPGEPATLWRMPTTGGPATRVIDGVVDDLFAVLDKGIYYVQRQAGETQLHYYNFATTESTTIARGLGDVVPLLTASSDGRTILFGRRDVAAQDLMLVEHFR